MLLDVGSAAPRRLLLRLLHRPSFAHVHRLTTITSLTANVTAPTVPTKHIASTTAAARMRWPSPSPSVCSSGSSSSAASSYGYTTSATPPPLLERDVKIVEVGPRDGLQNEKGVISLATKLALIERLRAAGLRHIEAGSFVSPKWVPQMADSAAVLKHLDAVSPSTASGDVTFSYLVPNVRGLQTMLSIPTSPTPSSLSGHENEIAIFASASEGFSRKNLNCSVAESLLRFAPVASAALEHGFRVRGYVSMVIACPYSGPTPPEAVADAVDALLAMGCYEVSLGDTNGVGTPGTVGALLRHLVERRDIPPDRLAGHFHDTYGQAIVNCFVALQHGIRTFDASVAGLGGCPYAKGATGNVATEDLVYFLEGSGISTGVNLDALVDAGEWVSKQLGRENGSRVGKALAARKMA